MMKKIISCLLIFCCVIVAYSQPVLIDEQRKQNIQYAIIALSIIYISRSFIANTKLIQGLGIVALLIVFEFLNLLLHLFLERITNHSPVLMLALVFIAALLVPLHHKLEYWATTKLVEKIRRYIGSGKEND